MRNFVAFATIIAVALAPVAGFAADDPYGGQKVRIAAELSGLTQEVLVLASAPVVMPTTALAGRKAIELQNLGPNDEFCCIGTASAACTPVVNKSRRVAASGGTWSLDVGDKAIVKCIAATADQVTGAATIVTEVR